MRKPIYIIILSLLFGCNHNTKTDIVLKKGMAIVAGEVHNVNDSVRVLRFTAQGVVKDIEQTVILDSLGNFRTVIELFAPQEINLFYENGSATLYLEAGDSIFLDIDADLFKKVNYPYYKITGLNSSTSQNIRDYFRFHNPYTYKPVYYMPIKEFLHNLKEQINFENSILNKFCIKENPTSKFKYWAQNFIKYSLANYLLSYFAYYDRNRKQYKTDIFNTDLFPVDKDSAIVSSLYITHLSNYTIAKYIMSDSTFAQLNKKKEIRNAYCRVFDNLIKNEKPGLSRDIMIYKVFHSIYDHRSPEVTLDSLMAMWESFKVYINNPMLLNIVNEDLLTSKNQATKNNASVELNSELKFKTVDKFLGKLHSKHKDKVIYIDIWATWCSPCRAEIPFSIELQDYFKDKPIAFVNLCLSSNKRDWEKVVSQKHIKGDNYFFNEEETDLFISSLRFAGYPTYMIMDKRGNLINRNAPRPSSGAEIKSMLKKSLGQY